jgi:hypothetical protein
VFYEQEAYFILNCFILLPKSCDSNTFSYESLNDPNLYWWFSKVVFSGIGQTMEQFLYRSIVWLRPEMKTLLGTLQKLKRRATRNNLVVNHCHSEPLFRKLKILNVSDHCWTRISKFFYKTFNSLLSRNYLNYSASIKDKLRKTKNNNLFQTNAPKLCRANALVNRGLKLIADTD